MLDLDISEFFDADGPLATALPGYKPRPSQVELSQAIGQAIQDRATLVAEAGTGIGKTWAYLVPAFIQGGKVLISTGTRTLQDQLFARDLPRVRAALAAPVTAALLKGRGNYVCHYHLDRLQGDERALKSRTEIQQLRQIQVFADISKTGDRGDLAQVPEDADIWQRVTSTRENCLGQECPRVRDCFLMKARRQAQDADLVVVNHALFMADLALREEGITDLLPAVDAVIFDEAHQLPDIATRFLGSSVSSSQLLELARNMEAAGLAQAREATNWSEAGKRLEQAARELRLAAAPIDKLPGRKATFEAIPEADPELVKTFEKLGISLEEQKRLAGVAVDVVFDSVSVKTTFQSALKEKGIPPEAFTLNAYAAVEVIKAGIERAKKADNAEAVAKALKDGTPIQTAIGKLSYGKTGDLSSPSFSMFKWEGGKIVAAE